MRQPRTPRPDLEPDADLEREEMEAMQREIAAAAIFEDDHDVAVGSLSNPLEAASSDRDRPEPPLVAGVDQSFLLESERALSAVVVMQAGEVVERVHAVTPLEIPYIPGLLAFREGGPILAALEGLSTEPDLFLFDGSGRIHFRQAGIATHIGVVLDVPSVGIAKSLLCGEPRGDVDDLPAGTTVPIDANSRVDAPAGTVLGYAVQTRQYDSPDRAINPLYVSPGHRVGPETAADGALELATTYKLPEPIRLADAYADEAKRTLEE
ncbi:endonuclease V [Natrarchaeobius halalkaliphilus]|uniref:Endonuclease V n=1 Tax=Natrarchaeobius halalkaliphilus TaxID=1679091 RepID=A0A3N6MXH7_9EURY|nr:endonuclease V [Natrarchaeobius halalkaliphilus]RQG90212.1 endonuclease V [Natrarchaeobius halalkaliphilus]